MWMGTTAPPWRNDAIAGDPTMTAQPVEKTSQTSDTRGNSAGNIRVLIRLPEWRFAYSAARISCSRKRGTTKSMKARIFSGRRFCLS